MQIRRWEDVPYEYSEMVALMIFNLTEAEAVVHSPCNGPFFALSETCSINSSFQKASTQGLKGACLVPWRKISCGRLFQPCNAKFFYAPKTLSVSDEVCLAICARDLDGFRLSKVFWESVITTDDA